MFEFKTVRGQTYHQHWTHLFSYREKRSKCYIIGEIIANAHSNVFNVSFSGQQSQLNKSITKYMCILWMI